MSRLSTARFLIAKHAPGTKNAGLRRAWDCSLATQRSARRCCSILCARMHVITRAGQARRGGCPREASAGACRRRRACTEVSTRTACGFEVAAVATSCAATRWYPSCASMERISDGGAHATAHPLCLCPAPHGIPTAPGSLRTRRRLSSRENASSYTTPPCSMPPRCRGHVLLYTRPSFQPHRVRRSRA